MLGEEDLETERPDEAAGDAGQAKAQASQVSRRGVDVSATTGVKELLEVGKDLGLSGMELRDFIKEQQDRERDERRLRREIQRERYAHEEAMARIAEESAVERSSTRSPEEVESKTGRSGSEGFGRTVALRLKIPKYEARQDISSYLDLFEGIMRHNGNRKEEWPILLRATAVGTVLEDSIALELMGDYEEIKRELLLSYGVTASTAWKELLEAQQRKETFRQYCLRVTKMVARWTRLACSEAGDVEELALKPDELKNVEVDEVLEALVRQVVLDSVDKEFATFLRRALKEKKDFEDFCKAGTTYQTSRSRERPSQEGGEVQPRAGQSSASRAKKSPGVSTTQCFGLSFEEVEKKLFALGSDKRKEYLKKQNLCWNCLKPGHRSYKCASKSHCTKCQHKHHVLMHDCLQSTSSSQAASQKGIKSYGCQAASPRDVVHLMSTVAEVKGQHLRAKVRVFMDLGSQASFVSQDLVEAIKPKHLATETVLVSAFGVAPATESLSRYEIELTGSSKRWKVSALQRPRLGLNITPVDAETVQRWRLRGVELQDTGAADISEEIHLLIGADFANDLLMEKKVVDGETAWRTDLGWVLSGPGKSNGVKCGTIEATVACVHAGIECLWELDQPPSVGLSKCLPAFPFRRVSGGYEVGLLWKGAERPVDNRKHAERLVTSLVKRLERSGQQQAYEDVLITEYGEIDAIELEPEPDQAGFYMPHHAVVREGASTTKLRVVFNASFSACQQPSLNDALSCGPSLLPSLTSMLLRFREFSVGIQADIRKAFFMVGMRTEDRKYLRFLWPDGDGCLTTWRLKRLPFGVKCSPFLLSAVLHYHLQTESSNVEERVQGILHLLEKSLYVDDCVTSLESTAEAVNFKEESSACLKRAGMDLRKWRSNELPPDKDAGEKVLGLQWDTRTDTLKMVSLSDQTAVLNGQWTQRSLLRALASLFDPLGLASPVQLRGKLLMQKTWKAAQQWDEPLEPEIAALVGQWYEDMRKVTGLSVPRWIGWRPNEQVALHVFADASESGYGCCVYGVRESAAHLMYSKARVAPLKTTTLPRLELQAAYFAVRHVKEVFQSLRAPVKRVVAWSDSRITLLWISGQPFRWKTWVRNRVAAIQEVSAELGITWRHVPGTDNPADSASRGLAAEKLSLPRWLHGPEWLLDSKRWPPSAEGVADSSEEVLEEVQVGAVLQEHGPSSEPWWSRLSKWTRMVGVVKCMLRWRLRSQLPLSEGELKDKAERFLCRIVQDELFGSERQCLLAGKPLPRESKLAALQPFIDEVGLMRVRRRLDLSELPYETSNPIILGKHHITEVFVRHQHQVMMHQGTEILVAKIRSLYWIFGLRRMLRSIKDRCVVCRRYAAKTADVQSGPLPADRVVWSRPFSACGIDYAGPLLVSGSLVSKVWIVLFVCAVTRGVHLDIVQSLSLADFLLTFRRFVARRGEPKLVRSDNATTFVAASKTLSIDWKFNPPNAPWFGGFYERLVGAIKLPLKKVLGRALLNATELYTVICEIEAVVNQRPLVHVGGLSDEPPLTPANLMGSVWSEEVQSGELQPISAGKMKRRMKNLLMVSEHLRGRWTMEYLSSLRTHHLGRSRPVRVGDVVLLEEDSRKRQAWRMGRVQRLYEGKDGRHRVALLSIGGGSTLMRPIRRLVPLEVEVSEDERVEAPASLSSREHCASDAPQVARTRTRIIRKPDRLNL